MNSQELQELREIQRLAHAQHHEDNSHPSSSGFFWLYIGTRFGCKEQSKIEAATK